MRLGIGSYSFGWAAQARAMGEARSMTAMELLERAAALEVDVVQIADNMPLDGLSCGQLDGLAREAKRRGIQLEAGTRMLTEENLARYVAIAARIGSPLLRMVIDGPGYAPGKKEIVRVIRSLVPALEQARVTLALENHDRFTAVEFRDIIRGCESSRVGVCLDSVNSIGAAEGIEHVSSCLAEYTVNLHIKDFTIRRLPYLMGFVVEGRPAGQGMLNIPRLIELVEPYGSGMSAILELWTPPESDFADTLSKELQWVRQSVAFLRTMPQFCRASGPAYGRGAPIKASCVS